MSVFALWSYVFWKYVFELMKYVVLFFNVFLYFMKPYVNISMSKYIFTYFTSLCWNALTQYQSVTFNFNTIL